MPTTLSIWQPSKEVVHLSFSYLYLMLCLYVCFFFFAVVVFGLLLKACVENLMKFIVKNSLGYTFPKRIFSTKIIKKIRK